MNAMGVNMKMVRNECPLRVKEGDSNAFDMEGEKK